MTYRELSEFSRQTMQRSNVDSFVYDTWCLLEHFFGIKRIDFPVKAEDSPDVQTESVFIEAVKKRSNGYPLQYILGKWTFMDCQFYVGDGVLIPRDDTEVCVRSCTEWIDGIKKSFPIIIDLCSGSGAIAISLAKKYPFSRIYAAELSDKAYSYLVKNIELNQVRNVFPLHQDISQCYENFDDHFFDVIISNPPYIRTEEITSLQKEVQYEPLMALDGGTDGLIFYHLIVQKWISKLKSGGVISLEIGEDQGNDVSKLLKQNQIENITIIKDIQGFDRTVFGTKK